ncbi:serum response factor homolog isoform X2 [Cryptotermes secundus]|uniref:serum response factor homolog isoform X2 n=1 Tax=Cryptotermes secundus TaxID=105785 RepID=UPI000CD7C53D|nr:serum response factor homolog isoform X2 [Cryptotermes secundus]
MDTPTGGGRDSRFNIGYNMSLISGETSSEIYATTGHSRPSTSLSSGGVSRPSMLPSTCGAGIQRVGVKRTSSDVCFDQEVSGRPSMASQSGMGMAECGSDIGDDSFSQAQKKTPPPNGKKTKGRVKIKMEYIDNKLRRYTTFSKRKTGIMKKAYELSTLTGTQVMLLVASETGHVYTFATRKLQPMITSEAGKALIQTCLNSPDPPPSGVGGDQRMSATGFEETELTYNIGDDEQKEGIMSPRSENGGADSGGDSSGNESPTPDQEAAGTPDARGNSSGSNEHQQGAGAESRSPGETQPAAHSTQQQLISGSGGSSSSSSSSHHHHQQQASPHQQFITIPLPMALSAAAAAAAANGNHHHHHGARQEAADLTKSRK